MMRRRVRTLVATVLAVLVGVTCVSAAAEPAAVTRTVEVTSAGNAHVAMDVPAGATYAVATVTAHTGGGDLVQPRIRDDLGGWWNGPTAAGEAGTTISRAVPSGMRRISFVAHAPDGSATRVAAEVTFSFG